MIIREPIFNGYIVQCGCGHSFHIGRHDALAECPRCGWMASAVEMVTRFAIRRTAPHVDLYRIESDARHAAREAWVKALAGRAKDEPS